MSSFEAQLAAVKTYAEAKIDFKGQERVVGLTLVILWIFGIIAFVVGFAVQSAVTSAGIFGAGFLIACLVGVPGWKSYNSHPVKWLDELDFRGNKKEPALEAKKTK